MAGSRKGAALRSPRPGAHHGLPRRPGRTGLPPHGQPDVEWRLPRLRPEVPGIGVRRARYNSIICDADVAKLADALDLGSSSREGVKVQVLSSAPSNFSHLRGIVSNQLTAGGA